MTSSTTLRLIPKAAVPASTALLAIYSHYFNETDRGGVEADYEEMSMIERAAKYYDCLPDVHMNVHTAHANTISTTCKQRFLHTNTTCCEPAHTATEANNSVDGFPKTMSKSSWKERWLPSFLLRLTNKNSLNAIQATLPRTLSPNDVALNWPELKAGLKMRAKDEQRLLALQETAMKARQSQNREAMIQVANQMAEIIYGKGMTAEMQKEHLIRYGCAAWTDDAVQYLQQLGLNRGFVEVGAGNGQWARRLSADAVSAPPVSQSRQGANFEYVVAYDDYSSLPMNPHMYAYSGKIRDKVEASFCPHVRRGSHIDAFEVASNEGRILLLVYPPPGSMALETLRAYTSRSPQNDTLIYVGEGRGGANADDEFFNLLEGCESGAEKVTQSSMVWVLHYVMDLAPFGRGKGFERMFVFKRIAQETSDKSC